MILLIQNSIGNSGPVTVEIILGWVHSETYEFENNISATVNLSSTHVLKIHVQESDINYDSFFQKFWQIEISETKAKSFSDYSKHVYFNGHKYEKQIYKSSIWHNSISIPVSFCDCKNVLRKSLGRR